jgi:hypothetical protein
LAKAIPGLVTVLHYDAANPDSAAALTTAHEDTPIDLLLSNVGAMGGSKTILWGCGRRRRDAVASHQLPCTIETCRGAGWQRCQLLNAKNGRRFAAHGARSCTKP